MGDTIGVAIVGAMVGVVVRVVDVIAGAVVGTIGDATGAIGEAIGDAIGVATGVATGDAKGETTGTAGFTIGAPGIGIGAMYLPLSMIEIIHIPNNTMHTSTIISNHQGILPHTPRDVPIKLFSCPAKPS